jgi:hypothetical protein
LLQGAAGLGGQGEIMRFFSALVAALVLASAPVAAQTDIERVQAQASWAQELGQFSISAISFFSVADQASVIAARASTGELSQEDALTALAGWRAGVDAEINRLREIGGRLSAGPSSIILGQENVVALMRQQPDEVLAVITEFINATEVFTRDSIEGNEPDANAFISSQYAVLQTYTAGNAAINELAIDTVEATHPQRFLLRSWVANSTATVLALELARQELGAEPSIYSVSDYSAEIARLDAVVRASARDGRAATLGFSQQVDIAYAAAQSDAERAQLDVVRAMMATYGASFDAEMFATDVFSGMVLSSRPLSAPDEFMAFMGRVAEYEAQRDTLQLQRQEIAARLQ